MKHTHKFVKEPAKRTSTWRCVYCSWFVHDGLSHVLLSKDAECWDCGETFRLTEPAISEAKPRCDKCRIGVSFDTISIDEILRDKGVK